MTGPGEAGIQQRTVLPIDFLLGKVKFQCNWPVTPGAKGARDTEDSQGVLSPEGSPGVRGRASCPRARSAGE